MSAAKFDLEAELRDELGKGASRRLRRKQKVLGIVYGGDEAPTSITLEQRKVVKALEDESFYSRLLAISVDGKKQQVVLKDLQRHPYKPVVLHMDFLRVKASDMINMTIPLHFVGVEECPGVKAGGIMNHLISDVEVKCQAGSIPEFIEVNVSNLELDNSVSLSELKVPDSVEILMLSQDQDPSVASVHLPRVTKADEEQDAEAAATAEGDKAEAEGEGDKSEDAKSEESK